MKKYFKEILEDKLKKLANLQCDLAVFDTLESDVFLGETTEADGTKKKLTLDFAKEHIKRQIAEVERSIEVNKKIINGETKV